MKKTITIKAKVYKPKQPLNRYPKSGIKVEKEHTPNTKLASVINANHIDEHPSKKSTPKKPKSKYYPSLKKMEKKLKKVEKK